MPDKNLGVRDEFYKRFSDPTEEYQKETRSFCYDLARSLIKKARNNSTESWYTNNKVIQAIILLLFCWNFAAKETKNINMKNIRAILQKNKSLLEKLEKFTLLTFSDEEKPLIKKVFESFRDLLGQTGASKALSLLNPALFPMWDTAIRGELRSRKKNHILMRGIDNGQTGEQYIKFMIALKKYSTKYKFQSKLASNAIVAKKIDEYHYVKIVMNR